MLQGGQGEEELDAMMKVEPSSAPSLERTADKVSGFFLQFKRDSGCGLLRMSRMLTGSTSWQHFLLNMKTEETLTPQT